MKYWIAVVSKDHINIGVDGGFIQVCHGKSTPLKRMKKDDWIIVYSPVSTFGSKNKCQSFTAIGKVSDDDLYQFKMNENFNPFRRNVDYFGCKETSILPLIDKLTFIENKQKWGFKFRFGLFDILEKDFELIKSLMLN